MSAEDSSGRPAKHRATVAGVEVDVTPTEHRLLEALRGQPGRAFTRAELVALAMPGTVVLERTIDVHVKGLRKKLGALAGVIEAVPRVGYRFVPPGQGPGADDQGR